MYRVRLQRQGVDSSAVIRGKMIIGWFEAPSDDKRYQKRYARTSSYRPDRIEKHCQRDTACMSFCSPLKPFLMRDSKTPWYNDLR